MCRDGNNPGFRGSNRLRRENSISMRTSSSRPTAADTSRPARRTAVLAAAGAVLLSVALAGCGTDDGGTTGAPASDSKSPTGSATTGAPGTAPATTAPGGGDAGTATAPPATRTGTPAATAGDTAKGRSASSRCTVTDLKMTLGRGDPGAGNIYFPLDFTNTGATACTLDGFPGVSLLRGDGSVIGKPADRQPVKASAVRVAPGETVEADLHTVNEGIKDGGCWRKPTLIMVYPPGSKQSMTLATSNPVVCGDTFDVGPVH
jgi:hypothetical protein